MTKGRNRKKHGNDGKRSKVFPTEFENDSRGRFYWFCNALDNLGVYQNGKLYVPTCNYGLHKGLVEDLSVCHSRHCGMLRLINPRKADGKIGCDALYKVHIRKDKSYVNQSR